MTGLRCFNGSFVSLRADRLVEVLVDSRDLVVLWENKRRRDRWRADEPECDEAALQR